MSIFLFTENIIAKALSIYRESRHYIINRRMHFVYLKHKGYSVEMIADILMVSRKTIWEWTNIYQEGGLNALATLHYKGQSSQLNQYGKQLVLEFMKNPVATLKEAQHQITKLTNLERSLTQIKAFFKRFKIKRRKVGQIPAKADIDQQNKFKKNKLERLIKLANSQRIKLFFIDAAHFVHQPFLGYLYGIKRLFIRSAAGRKRFNVLGALDAISKSITTICNETYINAQTICQLLELLAHQYIGEKIYLILDNAPYQKCQIVQQTAQKLNIQLVYLPAYSPNLNLIERLCRFTKKKILYNKFYSSFDEFKIAITDCLGNGYGFPFDRSYLSFYFRLQQAIENIDNILSLFPYEAEQNKMLWKVRTVILKITDNKNLRPIIKLYQTKVEVFEKLRHALRSAPEHGHNGLADVSIFNSMKELKLIQKAVAEFTEYIDREIGENKNKKLVNSYKLVKARIEKYHSMLFSDPIEIEVDGKKRMLFFHHTNNILERHFRTLSHNNRRISGKNSLKKNLENMHPSTPLAMNLKNRNYVKLIFGDELNIATKFSEIDIKKVRQKIAEKKVEKCSPSRKIKKIIRKKNFLYKLSHAYKVQVNYAKVG